MSAVSMTSVCYALGCVIILVALAYYWVAVREEKGGDVWHETPNTCPPPKAGHRCTKCGGCPLQRRQPRRGPIDGAFNSKGW